MKSEVVWEGKLRIVNFWSEDEEKLSLEVDFDWEKFEKRLKMFWNGNPKLTKTILLSLIGQLENLKLDLQKKNPIRGN